MAVIPYPQYFCLSLSRAHAYAVSLIFDEIEIKYCG
jgi:hypothetical protein